MVIVRFALSGEAALVRGECYLGDGRALVLLACKRGHVAFVVKPIKNRNMAHKNQHCPLFFLIIKHVASDWPIVAECKRTHKVTRDAWSRNCSVGGASGNGDV